MAKIKIPQVYAVTNKITGMVYIVKTDDLGRRWIEHKQDAKDSQLRLYRAIRKYGIENFIIEPIAYFDSIAEALQAEIFWVAEMRKFLGYRNVYNATDGGESLSGEANPMYGKRHTQEAKDAISAKNSGRRHSDESSRKKSIAGRGHGSSLTKEQVTAIFNDPRSQHTIANEYGIIRGNVQKIKSGKTFSYLTGKVYMKGSNAKLTPEQALQILDDPRNDSEIALAFNAARETVHNIKTGRQWSSVTGLENPNKKDRLLNDASSRTKLTKEQVIAIYRSDDSIPNIAKQYGVHETTIRSIKTGKAWSDITQGIKNG